VTGGWMIHGVVAADAPRPDDAPAHERLAAGDLLALASPVSLTGDPATDAAEAVRHNAVLTAYATRCAVAPARFGAVLDGPDAAAARVAGQAAAHRAFLARIGDGVELGARIVAAAPLTPAPEAASSAGTYLRRQAARRDAARRAVARRAEAAQALADALTATAREWRAFAPAARRDGPARLAELALLAPRDALAAFRGRAAALGAAAARDGLAVEITGPWPPYSFAEPAP